MIPKEVIEKAIEGGWIWYAIRTYGSDELSDIPWSRIICDPLFWQSLGKALGWKGVVDDSIWRDGEVHGVSVGIFNKYSPGHYAHLFFDLLLTGGDTEKFWADLIKK